jgi:hypothetical protein
MKGNDVDALFDVGIWFVKNKKELITLLCDNQKVIKLKNKIFHSKFKYIKF